MSGKFEIGFDPRDIKRFNDDIDKLFDDINDKVSTPKNYTNVVEKTRKGIKEGSLPGIVNQLDYAKLKVTLKGMGIIYTDNPLGVTGQLVDDFAFYTLKKSPNEVGGHLTFSNHEAPRPTIGSMKETVREGEDKLEYVEISSADIVEKLHKTGNFPIMDSIQRLYEKDYVKQVELLINRAFKNADRS